MNLSNIDTSKFLADPKSETFEKDLIKRSKVFNIKVKGVERKQVLTYLVVMYDFYTELRRNIKEYIERKITAAEIAEFPTTENNRFTSEIEDLLIGKNAQFNKAVIEYVSYMYDRDFLHLIVVEDQFKEFTTGMYFQKECGKDFNKVINDLKQNMEVIEDKLFGGKETINLLKALYEGTATVKLKVRIEDVNDEFQKNGLKDFSPYGNYVPEDLKFVGDEIPE